MLPAVEATDDWLFCLSVMLGRLTSDLDDLINSDYELNHGQRSTCGGSVRELIGCHFARIDSWNPRTDPPQAEGSPGNEWNHCVLS